LDEFTVVLVLAWLAAVIGPLLNSVLGQKYRTSVGDQIDTSSLARLADRLSTLALVVFCLICVGRRVRALPTDRRLSLVLLLAPWVCLVVRDTYAGNPPRTFETVLFPVLVVTVWVLRPHLTRLSTVGYLVGATAVLCMLIAVVLPSKGLFVSAGGDFIAPEKQILPWGVLVGVFSNGNVAGQFLAAGLPAVTLVRRSVHRLWILSATILALVWTSSRSSIAASLLALLLCVVLPVLPRALAGLFAALCMLTALLVVVGIALTATTDAAFTNRGYIWRISVHHATDNLWFGLGPDWYYDVGKFANALPGTAFHGHNLFVHTLVIGGLSYALLIALLVAVVAIHATSWARRHIAYPTAFVVAFLVSGTLEVPFGVVDRGYIFVVTAIPMAVIAFAARPADDAPDRPGPADRALVTVE
jgi:hypothetical protein